MLVLFLAGSLSSGGFSQDRAGSRESTVIPDKMTLRQCMEYAVEHSARVKVAQADLSDTRVERREAVLKTFTPQVSASSYGYYNWGRSVDPETNTYSNIKSFHNG